MQRPAIGSALTEIINRGVEEQLKIIVAGLEPQQPGSVEMREQIERMSTPALTELSRLVSEIADTVLAPVLQRQREQRHLIANTTLPPSGDGTRDAAY